MEEPSKRPAKQFRLAYKADICAQDENQCQEYQEIPIGRMRRADQNKFWQVWQSSLHFPAKKPQKESGKIMKYPAENRCVKNGGLQFVQLRINAIQILL
jgi:hypothetical protein